MKSLTTTYSPSACQTLRTAQGGYPGIAALPDGTTNEARLISQCDAADRAFLRTGMASDGAHVADEEDHPLLQSFRRENPGSSGERLRKDFLLLLRQDLYDVATAMDRLSGGATLIMQTGNTHAKIINIPENNFAQVYFTLRWMERLSSSAHEPLSNIVSTFINSVQVPVIAQQRAQLGDDDASENVKGHTHTPSSLVPATMTLNAHPCSPWRGGLRGRKPHANTLVLPHLRIISISDSDDSDTEENGAIPSTPSRPPSNMKCVDAASLAGVTRDLKRYASPYPFLSKATPTLSTPLPTSSAISAGSNLVSPPATSYYTRFSPIIPSGPSSERWLAENQWPPRFTNVLREVAEDNSLGKWADVLVEKHNVDRESAGAMVKCLLEDFERQSLPPTY
ncbi:hypothetical protein FIBSPDRAFT_956430 [Athelia psychrophila]|uniref:Uncharacterized protein n=1 Tax=Athelia psychrophila TaxID=1759441 RepID=A0A166GXE1_9AGAM|nr:hypothetical protein FIBSPDRAFT_956430 [Fibularhizoctonia sp. CBS 109695]